MKRFMKRVISMILVIAMVANFSLTGFALNSDGEKKSAGDVFSFAEKVTWAEAGKQIAGMLSYIVEDAANIDLAAHSARIENLSLEDDSVYLAILAEEGYLPEEPAKINPAAAITADEYVQLMEKAFPTVVDSQEAIDSLRGESKPGNIAILGDDLSVTTMLPERVAVAKAQQLTLTAVKASVLSLNAGSSVNLSESEISRVHIRDTAVKEEAKPGEKVEPDVIYLHMDSGTQLPEVIVKNADEVVIEGSGALGVVRVQEAVGSLTVRATGSVVNETEEPIKVTGPDAQVVELQPGEQADFVLSKWLVSFVTEGTPVETQEIAPGGMIDFTKTGTTLEGKIFTAWYEDADYTTPVSRLAGVDKQTTLYARFVDKSEAVTVTFETFGGRKLEPMVFAKGEYLLTKPVESLYTSKEGYSFGGWCVDEECTTAFGYTDPIEKSMTLYAMYSSYEQEVREDPGTVAEIELSNGAETIGLVLPQGMTAAKAEKNITVEVGTGLEAPEISVRETENGAELYCEAGFTPGSTFTLYAENGVRFAGYPEYIDTLTVSVFREQVEVVQFAEGLTYALWDNVTDYTPVSNSGVAYTTDYSEDDTVHNVIEDHDAKGDVIPGKLTMTGKVNFQPGQVVVFYDGEIGREEAPVDAWEGGDLAGYVLFAQIETVTANEDGTSEVTFIYADPEDYIAELDVHSTEEVNIEELMDEDQIAQVEKAIASQLSSNDELKAQMLVAVMTSEDTQKLLDEKYGANTYSLAALVPYVSNPKLDIKLSVEGSTATAGIGVGITVSLYGPQGLLATITPYLYFEEQLTLDVNVDGGFLWVDMSVLFKTKTTVSLQLKATTGDGMDNILDEAKTTLEKIVNADGTASEDVDYQEAADSLMNTMQELIGAELEYQDLFAVPLLKFKYTFYGIITFGINVELVGQAAVVATFGVTVTAEYGQKIGFNYNFLKGKGGSYKEKLASEVTTEVYLIGKIGVRVGIAVTLYIKLLQNVTVSVTGSIYAYVELAGMFLYTYALSAGGGNYAGALYLEVGIDVEIELGLEVEVLFISYEKAWTLWSARWPLYSKSIGMTMSVVQNKTLDTLWAAATKDADHKTSYPLPYIPMKTYDMLTASCTENQLLFENLQSGNVTAKLTLENIVINGEPAQEGDPRINVIIVGDGTGDHKLGVIYADEMAAAANKVELYQCDVVLTYENKNKSELIKNHQQVFPLSREFKMATTTVNVDIALYDWCAHAWGIESAEWDNDVVFETSFENTHVLGCPVEPTATGTIDLAAVIDAVKERYPEIDGAALSWFNPTLNSVDLTVQYSIPRISNMCYLTPNSDTVRYDIFATSRDYDLTFNLFASRYEGYSGEITYIIEAAEALPGAEFTVSGSDEAGTMSFAPVDGEENRWSLTADRAAFNGTERPIMMSLNGAGAVASGLTVTGRENGSVVILTLSDLSSALTVANGEGIDTWKLVSHDPSEMSAITPGEKVTLSAELLPGYEGLRLTSEPEGLQYTTNGNTVSFTMPSYDVTVTLEGVRYYQANFRYNYGDLGAYRNVEVERGETIRKPANPFVRGLTFAGWYDNAACEGEPFDFTRRIYGNITLYADWRVNVTVDLGGAEGQARYVAGRRYEEIDGEKVEVIDSKLVFPGNEDDFTKFTYNTRKLGETALEIILPNFDGYDFMGWYLTSDFSGDPVDPAEYVLTEGVVFHARWEKIAILTYELNYGEQEKPYAMTLEHVGMALEHIPEDPQREHYEFLGWFRTQDGGEANRVALDTYLAEGTMTLYAGWKPVEYAITYELGGGENAPGNPVSHSIESNHLPLFAPTRTGYDFCGWDVSGIDALYSDSDGGLYIPAGSVGEITLTAKWEPTVYTITYDLIRGKTAQANPDEYTIESEEIVLTNPTAEGYEFMGWTGTDLTEPTLKVVIPAGSVGDRSYKAKWLTNDPVGQIVAFALDAIPDLHTMNLADFTGIEDIQALAMELIAKDEKCKDYAGQLSVSVVQLEDTDQDGTSYLYPVTVTVTFTEDGGATTTDSKEIELTVLKNPVTITAEPVYTVGGKYIPYGTALSDVEMTGCVATSNGKTVEGSFTWDAPETVVLSANNGQEVYKVLFTPDDTANYSTAEVMIAVNTQIGVRLMLDVVPETIEYMGRKLNVDSADECGFYVIDADSGAKIDGVTPVVTGAVLQQSQLTPGTAKVWLSAVSGCTLTGDFDPNLYAVVSKIGEANGDTVTITRAVPVLSGTTEYTADLGSSLSSVTVALTAKTAYESSVDGSFAWAKPSTGLDKAGTFTYEVDFTPINLNYYEKATIQVTVNVNKKLVTIPTINPVVYNGSLQRPDVPNTAYYTVTSNNGGTNAGDYTVILKLTDPDNYQWAVGDNNETKSLTFTIQPAELKVSTGYTVGKLGYGQQLRPGKDEEADDRYQTANEIISNANVTMSNDTPVDGWWEWNDNVHAPNYGCTLNASASGDNEDFGDGYDVTAVFHPTSVTESNFIQLTHQFHVEVVRATPDYSGCAPYLKEGAIFQPASGTQVNMLSDFTPVLTNLPVNPVTGESVQGKLSWEEDKYPDKTDNYNLKFEPSGLYLDYEGVSGKNYVDNVIFPIHVEVKNSIDITFSIADGQELLYSSAVPGSNLVSTRTVQYSPSTDELGYLKPFSIQFALHNQYYPQKITISAGGNTVLTSTYKYADETLYLISSNGGHSTAFSLDYSSMKYGKYIYTFQRDGSVNDWMRKDLSVVIEMAQIPSTSAAQVSAASFGLRSRAFAFEPTLEPDVEPTLESTSIPEPGAIGNVVSVKPKQEAQQSGGVWMIPLEEDQALVEFQWEVSQPASEYYVYTLDEYGDPELYIQTTGSSVSLPVEDYVSEGNTLYVGAVLEDGSVTWGEAKFELIPFAEPTEEPAEETTEEPAEETTEEPAEETTEEPTEETTEEPTEETTEEPTEETTEEPTEKPTEEPAEETTEETTEESTEETTEKPAGETTEKPTEKFTEKSTEEPTQKSTVEPAGETTEKPAVEPAPEPSAQSTPEPTPEPAPATQEPIQEAQAAEEAA